MKPKIEIKCGSCGIQQEKDKNKSNENWIVYNCNDKCGCGGKFLIHLDGVPVGGGDKN